MDPNENLKEQRKIVAEINAARDADADAFDFDKVMRLADLVQAMDEWMTKGGFLPEAWVSTERNAARDRS